MFRRTKKHKLGAAAQRYVPRIAARERPALFAAVLVTPSDVFGERPYLRRCALYSVKVLYKTRRQYEPRNPISDAIFDNDGSYIPNQFIRGTIHLH